MAIHFWLMEPNFDEKDLQTSILKNYHFDRKPVLKFWNFLEVVIFGISSLNHDLGIASSKLRRSQGQIESNIFKIDPCLVGETSKLLCPLNVCTPCIICREIILNTRLNFL